MLFIATMIVGSSFAVSTHNNSAMCFCICMHSLCVYVIYVLLVHRCMYVLHKKRVFVRVCLYELLYINMIMCFCIRMLPVCTQTLGVCISSYGQWVLAVKHAN